MTLYLDAAATTPVHPLVADRVLQLMTDEFGNAGSRTHEWGARAKRVVNEARDQLAHLLKAQPEEVVFTSGATEANNLALLGLAQFGKDQGRTHIISSATEHKAVLEPLEYLENSKGFEVTLLSPNKSGRISPDQVLEHLRPDTLLVSLMLVNNETGIIQDVSSLGEHLRETPTYFHVDAAQGFAKPLGMSLDAVDMISISGHKIQGPQGVGALAVRRRGWNRVPLQPLMFGGGQERKLRPGTTSVPLVSGLALAAEMLDKTADSWLQGVTTFRAALLKALQQTEFELNGDQEFCAPHIMNIRFPGVNSEALIVKLKDIAGIATGSACTSASYTPSHVLLAMGLEQKHVLESVRLSWLPDTDSDGLEQFVDTVNSLATSS